MGGDEILSSYLYTWIYSCHIPGFFIVNGILKNRTNYISKVEKLQDVLYKQRKVWLYYLVFSLIFFLRFVIQVYYGHYSFDDLGMFVYNTASLIGMGVLWFLPTFALSEIVFVFFIKGKNIVRWMYFIVLGIAIISTYFYELHDLAELSNLSMKMLGLLFRVLIGSSFMLLGYWIDTKNIFDSKYLFLAGLVSILCILNGNVDLNNLYFHDIFLYYLFAVTGLISVFIIAKVIDKMGGFILKMNVLWGKNTMLIMCTHTILCIIQIVSKIIGYSTSNIVLGIIITLILSMIIELILISCWGYFVNTYWVKGDHRGC